MSPETPRKQAVRVAVGATREQAAGSFAPAHDDVFLTSFADFEKEVDLSAVDGIDLVVGESMDAVVQSVTEALLAGRDIELRAAVPPDQDGTFLSLLDRLELQITKVETLSGQTVLGLAPRCFAKAEGDALVLQAIRAANEPVSPRQTDLAEAADAASPRQGPKTATTPRPVPRLVQVLGSVQRLRHGRRGRAVALAVGGVAVVVLVGLGAWADSGGVLLAAVLPVVVGLSLLVAGACGYTTLLLARQVNVQTGRLERALLRNRTVVRKRTGTVDKRTTAVERRIAALEKRLVAMEKGQERFPFALEYLEALGELGAETAGRVRDLSEALVETGRAGSKSSGAVPRSHTPD